MGFLSLFTWPWGQRPLWVTLAAVWGVLLLWPGYVLGQRPLVYTPLPMTNAQSVIAQSRDLIRHIEHGLGMTVRIQYEQDYGAILDKFAKDEIDLVHLGPLPYILLRGKAPQAEPLVFFREQDGQPAYTCSLATAMDSGVDLAVTEGPVALTQPLSTCGYLTTAKLLTTTAGRDLHAMPSTFLGSHDAVALALLRGEFAVGGLKTSIGRQYAHLGLHLLVEGPLLPGFALIVNRRTLDGATRAALGVLLTGTAADVHGQWEGLGRWGMIQAREADYCGLRDLAGIRTNPDCGDLAGGAFAATLEEICPMAR